MKPEEYVVPKFGQPREYIKRFPQGSHAIIREDTRFVRGKFIEKRNNPLFHVVRITGFLNLEGEFGNCGLRYSLVKTYSDVTKAAEHVKKACKKTQTCKF